ncbi:MAG: HAD family hydrolase [Acidobacteriales bacterium]|nr:HAD family hydrolase [Terriglobales bacterium]
MSFRWTDFDAYLFDIDGTLLNTRDLVHYDALNAAMHEAYGVNTTIDGIQYHGKTDLGILRAALERAGINDATFTSNLPAALNAVRRNVSENSSALSPEVCCSIATVLDHLKQADKLLGVASGNLESVGWHKIAAAGLRDYFTFGCFSDNHETRAAIFGNGVAEARRRLGANATVCFIGDTPEDIRAAHRAGAAVIAVCTGVFEQAELSSLHPDLCVNSCSELLELTTSSHH